MVRALLAEYLLAEVLVIGDQQPVLGKRLVWNVVVRNTAGFVVDGEDIVRLITQLACDSRSGALVNKEPHLRGLPCQRHERIARKRLRCKEETRLDVFSGQAIIFREDLLVGRSVRQEVQYEINRQTRLFDDRLAGHDSRRRGDSVKELLVTHGSRLKEGWLGAAYICRPVRRAIRSRISAASSYCSHAIASASCWERGASRS